MKLSSLLFALLLMALGAKAQYTSLTVKETSGTWTSYGLDKLKITFSNDQMTLSNAQQTVVYPLSELNSMLFTDLPSAIERMGRTYTVVSLQGAKVQLSVPSGTLARVFDMQGKLCATARIGQEGTPVYIGDLQPGIFILRAGNEKHKILVK
ncbi:MAG: hypothetical protein J6W50_02145 [Bacteroidaceae bacterium]|nr:hypothetical protein [Bacteroidaceae bacterium]MBP5731493.1 hypothetical protein [Bacteroidaceae bacterium]